MNLHVQMIPVVAHELICNWTVTDTHHDLFLPNESEYKFSSAVIIRPKPLTFSHKSTPAACTARHERVSTKINGLLFVAFSPLCHLTLSSKSLND